MTAVSFIPSPYADYHRRHYPRSAYVYQVLDADGRVAYQVYECLWLGEVTFTLYEIRRDPDQWDSWAIVKRIKGLTALWQVEDAIQAIENQAAIATFSN